MNPIKAIFFVALTALSTSLFAATPENGEPVIDVVDSEVCIGQKWTKRCYKE